MRVENYEWNPQERDFDEIRPNQLIATRYLGMGFISRIIFVMGLRDEGVLYGRELYNFEQGKIHRLNLDGHIEIDFFERIYFEKKNYGDGRSSLRMLHRLPPGSFGLFMKNGVALNRFVGDPK